MVLFDRLQLAAMPPQHRILRRQMPGCRRSGVEVVLAAQWDRAPVYDESVIQ